MSTDVSTLSVEDDAPVVNPAPTAANRPLWQVFAGAGLVIAALYAWGGWALPVVVISIIVMVMFHELGHFATAKWTGMRATEFFVGFGPKLWSKQIGDTEFGIKGIVLGGYVRIIGMTSMEEVAEIDEPRSFRQATFPRRVLVASAGSIMHLLMALVLAWCSLVFVGQIAGEHAQVGSFTPWEGHAQNAAQIAGLRVGDTITSLDGIAITSLEQFDRIIARSSDVALPVVVERDGRTVSLTVTPRDGRTITVVGQKEPLVAADQPAHGYIGIGANGESFYSGVPALSAIPKSFSLLWSTLVSTVSYVTHIFTPSGIGSLAHQVTNNQAASNPQNQLSRPTSIIGAANIADQLAAVNPANLFVVFMALNLSVGVLNMLPMLPLDGGHVAIAVYERLRSRRGRPAYHADAAKLLPVIYGFVFVLFMIFASTIYLDITHPVSLP